MKKETKIKILKGLVALFIGYNVVGPLIVWWIGEKNLPNF